MMATASTVKFPRIPVAVYTRSSGRPKTEGPLGVDDRLAAQIP
jgi:hypothetical protein